MSALRKAATFAAGHEFWLVWLYGLPLLLASSLPWNLFLISLTTIPFFWLARRIAQGSWSVSTPLDLPILLLLVMGAVGVGVSANPSASLRTYFEVGGGIAFFYGLVNGLRGRDVRQGAWVLVAFGLALGLVGILGLRFTDKFIPISVSSLLVPQVDFSFLNPRGFTPNIVAGAVAPIIPICWAWAADRSSSTKHRVLLAGVSLLLCGVIVATQSRGALLGLAAGVLVLVVWRVPRLLWLAPVGAVILAGIVYWFGVGNVADVILQSDSTGNALGRLELWDRALIMLQDFPFTGIGLGMFEQIVFAMYPLFLNSSNAPLPQTHNLYIQMGVDYGLPGLIAFIGLVTTAVGVAIFTTSRTRSQALGWLAAGSFAGLLVFLVHGLLDGVAVSTKVSLVAWFLLALIMHLGSKLHSHTGV